MFISLLIDGEERLVNFAHILWIRERFIRDGETETKVSGGCEVRTTTGATYFPGNDFEQVKKLLNFYNQQLR